MKTRFYTDNLCSAHLARAETQCEFTSSRAAGQAPWILGKFKKLSLKDLELP